MTLKNTQVKVASILGPLARLSSIMKAKQKILQKDDDEAVSGYMGIAGLFE